VAAIPGLVVRWEWIGPHAAVEKPFVTIAPIRWRETRVGELVEHLYAILSYDQGEIVAALRGGRHNPYRSRWGTVTIDFGSITQTVPSDYEVSCGTIPSWYPDGHTFGRSVMAPVG
jgi:hypothetical protein